MAIQEPRKFVTTDQGHADVFNVPIATLYENDQEIASQVEEIKNNPEANGVASKKALEDHVANTDLHVTAAKQAAWNAAQANAEQYTRNYAAAKAHTHAASDLPSATTQARGIVQLNNSTSSTATDQAATPNAVNEVRLASMPRNTRNFSGNLNDLVEVGFYDGNNMVNAPTNEWYYIEVFRHSGDGPTNRWITQILTSFNNGIIYIRQSRGGSGTWTGWTMQPTRSEIDDLKSSVANGKNELAAAIRDKGQASQGSDPFPTMATAIRNISTVAEIASGNFNLTAQGVPANANTNISVSHNGSVRGLSFTPRYVLVQLQVMNFDRDGNLVAWLSNLTTLTANVTSRDGAFRGLGLELNIVSGGFDAKSTHSYKNSISPSANIAYSMTGWYAIK